MNGLDAGLIAMRMRLSGGKEVAAEAEVGTAAIKETTAATEEANAAQKKTTASTRSLSSSLKSQIGAMRTVGRGLTKYVAAPLAALAIGSGVMAAHFDRSMNLVATDAGGSVKEVGRLKGEVLDLARHSQFGPNTLAESLFHVESSGYRGAKALKVLNEAQKLATTGNSDLQSTTYALVSATKALYGESLTNVNRTAAELNGIVAHGDMRLEELTSAMSTGVIPKAKAMGLNLRDVGAAMDVMTSRGIPAQRAAYALGFTLQKLIPYGEKAEDAFKSIGLGEEELVKKAQHGKFGYVSALEDLQSHLNSLPTKAQQTKVIEEMFGGGRMTSGLLTNLQNIGEMRKIYGELGDEVQKYNAHVKEAEEQPMVKAQRAWSSIQAGLIEIGQTLLPAAIPAMQAIAGILAGIAHGFAALSPSTQHWIAGIAAAAAILGPLLLLVAKLLEMWEAISKLSLISAAAGGIGELGAATGLAAGGELGGFGMMSKAGKLATGGVGIVASQVAGNAIGGKGGELVSNVGTGAAAGFMLGGPMGAAVGATAGTIKTALPEWEALLGLQKKVGPLQGRVTASAAELTGWLHKQSQASVGLTGSTQRLTHAQHNHAVSTNGIKTAQGHLNAVIEEYGAHSRPALHAELALTRQIQKHHQAINSLKKAEREHGAALSSYKTITNHTVLAERHRVNTLEALAEKQTRLYQVAEAANPASQRTQTLAQNLQGTLGKLSEAQQHQAHTIEDAAHKAGPAYATFLRTANQESLRFGGTLKAVTMKAQAFSTAMEGVIELEHQRIEQRAQLGATGLNGAPAPRTPKTPSGSPKHKKTADHETGKGTATLSRLQGKKGGTIRQPIIFALDRRGKRVLAEQTVEIQEDEEARQ